MARGRLTRSGSNKMIAGVAGGMAEYFDLDPTLIRILWVVAGLMAWGVLAYVLCWIFVPREPAAA